jgi:signal peptidase II
MADPFWEDGMTTIKLWSRLAPLALAFAALSFGLDQTIKWWLLNVVNMEARQHIQVLPFFDLVMAWNKGVSYSLFNTHPQFTLVASSVIISMVLWVWACRMVDPLPVAALGLVIGGALGNALDRITHGAVADFFLLHWADWNWYIFNPADVAIVAGVGLLLYDSFVETKKT